MNVSKIIHAWYLENKRDLPWRNTREPYIIWLSEIILQQTRVNQGLPYFERFIKRFPTVESLARASQEEIFRLWQGLGYYRRAENLYKTAKIVAFERNGHFPSTYRELLLLPGIGPYTASAIASFAFDEPVPVLDGNVFRVLARITGNDTPVNSHAGKKVFTNLAKSLLDVRNPALHNQAMMEFGALQCVPGRPACNMCPVQKTCVAFQTRQVLKLPVKNPPKKSVKRFLHFLLARNGKKIYIQKRTENDIWKNLYQLPLLETKKKEAIKTVQNKMIKVFGLSSPPVFIKEVKHVLTHRILHIGFWETEEALPAFEAVEWKDIDKFGFPAPLAGFLENARNMTNFENYK